MRREWVLNFGSLSLRGIGQESKSSSSALNQEWLWGCACECSIHVSVCECVHQRERKRRDWNSTPLSLASGQQKKRMGWVRMCGLLLNLPFCPSTHQPSMPCIQPELDLHTTSAFFTLLSTCMLLTDRDKAQNTHQTTRTAAIIDMNMWKKLIRAVIKLECTADAPLWRALQQTGNFPLYPCCPVTQPVTMEMSSASVSHDVVHTLQHKAADAGTSWQSPLLCNQKHIFKQSTWAVKELESVDPI